jgi:hypothetical protein
MCTIILTLSLIPAFIIYIFHCCNVSNREKLSLPAVNLNLMIHIAKLWDSGGHRKYIASVTVFTSQCLVSASNSGRSPSSGFPNCPQPQLPASHNSSSQGLNSSYYLINSPTCSMTLHQLQFLICPAYNILAWTV